jgi:Zn-dependent peptidase ImmA (M78 family)
MLVALHLKQRGSERVALTPALLSYWHGRLNTALFSRELKRVPLTCGKSIDMGGPVMGYYDYDTADPSLHIDSRCKTRADIINTLAHEMVHQLQHQRGLPVNHGKFFKRQAKRLAKHGVVI